MRGVAAVDIVDSGSEECLAASTKTMDSEQARNSGTHVHLHHAGDRRPWPVRESRRRRAPGSVLAGDKAVLRRERGAADDDR